MNKFNPFKRKMFGVFALLFILLFASCGEDVPFTLNGDDGSGEGIVPRPGSSDDGEGGSGGSEGGGGSGDGECMFFITGEGGVGGPDLFVQISSAADPQDPIHVEEGQPDKFLGPIGFNVDPNDSSLISLAHTNWPIGFIRFYGDPPADVKIEATKPFTANGTYVDGHIEFTIPELTISLVKPYSIDEPFDTGTEPIGPVTISTQPGQSIQGNHLQLTADGMPPDPNQAAPYPVKLVGGYVESQLGEELKSYLQDVLLGGAMMVEINGYMDRLPEEACSADGPPPPEDGEDPQDLNVGPEEFNIVDTQNDIPIASYDDMLALVGLREAFGQTVLDCKTPGAKGIDERLVEVKNILEDEEIVITNIEVFDSDDDGNIVHPLCADEKEFNRGTIFVDVGAECEVINQFNHKPPCTLTPGSHISTKVIYKPKNFIEAEEGDPLVEDTGYIVFTYQVGGEGEEKQYEFSLNGVTAPTPKDLFSVRRQGDVAPANPIKFGVPNGENNLELSLELVSTSEDAWDVLDIKIENDPEAKFTGPANWDLILPEASEEEPKFISFPVIYNPGVNEGIHSADLVITLRNQASPDIVVDLIVGLSGSIGIPDIGDNGYKFSAIIQVVGGFIDHGLLTDPLWSGPFYVNGREYPAVELEMKAQPMGNRMVKVELVMPNSYTNAGLTDRESFLNNFVDELGGPAQESIRRNETIRMWNLQGSKDSGGNGLSSDAKETSPGADCEQPTDLSKPFSNGCAHFYFGLFDELGDNTSIEGIYDRDTGSMIFPGNPDSEAMSLTIGNFYHAVLADLPGNGSLGNDPDYRIRTYLRGALFTGVFNQMTQTLMGLDEQPTEFVIVPDERFTTGLLNIGNKIDDGTCPDKYLNPDHWDVINGGDMLTPEEVLSGTPTFNCYLTKGGFLTGKPVTLREYQPDKNQGIWYYDTVFGFVGMFPEGVNDPNVPSFMKGTTAHFALQIILKAEPN